MDHSNRICFVEVPSSSNTVKTVAECVWDHYLRTTEKAGRSGVSTLSAAQQQELWVQYSALEVALNVGSHSSTFFYSLFKILLFLPIFSQLLLSDLSSDPPFWGHLPPRVISHSPVSYIFFSGNFLLLFYLKSLFLLKTYPFVLLRWAVTATLIRNSCPWILPSWSQSSVPHQICVPRCNVLSKMIIFHHSRADRFPVRTSRDSFFFSEHISELENPEDNFFIFFRNVETVCLQTASIAQVG